MTERGFKAWVARRLGLLTPYAVWLASDGNQEHTAVDAAEALGACRANALCAEELYDLEAARVDINLSEGIEVVDQYARPMPLDEVQP